MATRPKFRDTNYYVCDDKDCEEAGTNGNPIDGYWCDTHYFGDGSPYAGFL